MGGLASVWALTLIPGFVAHPILLLAGIVGGLFPDLDGDESMLQHTNVTGSKKYALKIMRLPALFFRPLGHRGALHSILACTFLSALLSYAAPKNEDLALIPLAFAAGFVSHLLLDSFTAYGVSWLWPLGYRFRMLPRGMRVRVRSPLDQLIGVCLLFVGALLVLTYPDFIFFEIPQF